MDLSQLDFWRCRRIPTPQDVGLVQTDGNVCISQRCVHFPIDYCVFSTGVKDSPQVRTGERHQYEINIVVTKHYCHENVAKTDNSVSSTTKYT